MKNNIVKFAIEDAEKFVNDEDMEMGLARVLFLSTRPNSHGLVITEEVLRKCASTVLGKWMIAEYNDYNRDVTTHTNNQVIIGNIPKDQEVEFVRAEDGYLDAYVDCVISKLYATKVYELFLSHNERSVSVEMMTDAEDGKGLVGQFNISAITVLGLDFNPSCPNANIKMIRFSDEDANEFYKKMNNFDLKKFAERRKNKLNPNNKEEVKKENMAENKDKKEEVLEEKEETKKEEKVSKKESKMAEEEKEKDKAKEANKMSEEEKDDDDDDKEEMKEEKMACRKDKMKDTETMESMKAKLADKEKIIMGYESELAELRKFKEDAMEEKKMAVVDSTLAKVKDKMEEDKYKEFSEKAKSCKFEEIDGWKNAVLASVTESFLKMSDENPDIMKFEIKKEEKQENKSLWDRL